MENTQKMQEPTPVSLRESFMQCRLLLVACLVVCLVIRLGVTARYAHRPIIADAVVYDASALSMLSGHGYAFKGKLTADKAPGYSAFLAGVYAVFGHRYFVVYLLQGLMTCLTCGAVVLLGYSATRRKAPAALAALGLAIYPPLMQSDVSILNDSLFGFVAFALTLILAYGVASRKLWVWALGGIVLGFALYIRPTAVAFPAIFLALALWRGWTPARAIGASAILVVITGLVLLPWAVRNYRVFGVFTPMPSQGGRVLYCNWSAMNQVSSSLGPLPENVQEMIGDSTGYERDRIFKRLAMAQIKERPGEFASSCVLKAIRQWTNLFWPQPPSKSTLVFAAANIVLLAMAIPAFWRRRIEPVFRGYTLLFVLYITFVASCMSSAEPRYAFWTYPFVFILAADTACELFDKLKGKF